ncbi:MAG: Gfo/Idh/MocA family oxidoreductase [Armatimonadota bacterium]
MPGQTVRLGVIGCGNIAGSHLRAINEIPQIEIVAAADINEERAESFAQQAGAKAHFTDWREMLQEVELDAIDQCTPHTLHLEPTVAAAERGIHVFTEKPMATELTECDAMIAACEDAGVVLMVGQVLRFRDPHTEARRLIDDGRIGEVTHVIRRRWGFTKESSMQPWSVNPDLAGSWVLYGFGSHAADLVLWITRSEAHRVFAMARQTNPIWDDVDDIDMQYELSNGAIALQSHSMNSRQRAWDLSVIGTEDSLHINGETIICGDEEITVPLQEYGGMKEQLTEFADAITEGREPEASGRDCRRTYALLEAARISMRTGQIVDPREL